MRGSTPSFISQSIRDSRSLSKHGYSDALCIDSLVGDQDRFKGRWPRGREFGQRRRPTGPELSKDRESDMFVIRVMVWLLRSAA